MTHTKHRKAAMPFILITLVVDILGIGIIVPILPELIKQFVGGDVASAGRYFGVIASVYALTQFFCAPVVGALSDRFGRRPVILLSLFGLGVDYLIQGFAPTIGWLFVGRVLSGMMGASYTTANAYIADISTPKTRARNFGLVGVAFGLGFILGPATGGLLGGIDIRLPFFAAAGLAMLNGLYGLFILPESLPPEKRGPFSLKEANPLGSVITLRLYPLVAGLAVAFALISLSQRGLENVWVLYCGYRFGWSEQANGLALALVGITAVLVQGGLVRPATSLFGERRTVVLGLCFAALAQLFYGLASRGWMMLTVIPFGSLAGLAMPAVQGLVAGEVPSSDQGKVQGALTSLRSLTAIVAPLVFTSGLFSFFTSKDAPIHLPGAPFFLGAVLLVFALGIVLRLFRRLPEHESSAAGESAHATEASALPTSDS